MIQSYYMITIKKQYINWKEILQISKFFKKLLFLNILKELMVLRNISLFTTLLSSIRFSHILWMFLTSVQSHPCLALTKPSLWSF